MEGARVTVRAGERVSVIMPHSEACMHTGIAGRRMLVELGSGPRPMAQPCTTDGRPYGMPLTPGEAGLYWDPQAGTHYAYASGGPGTAQPSAGEGQSCASSHRGNAGASAHEEQEQLR